MLTVRLLFVLRSCMVIGVTQSGSHVRGLKSPLTCMRLPRKFGPKDLSLWHLSLINGPSCLFIKNALRRQSYSAPRKCMSEQHTERWQLQHTHTHTHTHTNMESKHYIWGLVVFDRCHWNARNVWWGWNFWVPPLVWFHAGCACLIEEVINQHVYLQ